MQEVARIRDSLTPEERAHLGIIGTNYGEAGAINLYGPEYGLPRAISGVNSFWYRGYGDPPPQTVIILGLSRKYMDESFAVLPSRRTHPESVRREERGDRRSSRHLRLRSAQGRLARRSGRTSGITGEVVGIAMCPTQVLFT